MKAIKRVFVRIAAEFFQRVLARSRLVARLLFGVWFKPVSGDDYYFDLTTPVLANKALEKIRPESRVIDLGTGAVAVLGQTFWTRRGCQVVSCDLDPKIAELAAANVAYTGAEVEVVQSNFFSGVEGPFDVVTFNAPYVPTGTGTERGLSLDRRSQWDGGADGTDVIQAFFEQVSKLPHPATVYMGINGLHVSPELIRPLAEALPPLKLVEVYRPPLLPVDIYVVEHPGSNGDQT